MRGCGEDAVGGCAAVGPVYESIGFSGDGLGDGCAEGAADAGDADERGGGDSRLVVEVEGEAGDVGGEADGAFGGEDVAVGGVGEAGGVFYGEVDAVPDVGGGFAVGGDGEGARSSRLKFHRILCRCLVCQG